MRNLWNFYKWGLNSSSGLISCTFFAATLLFYLAYMMSAVFFTVSLGLPIVSGLMVLAPLVLGVVYALRKYKETT